MPALKSKGNIERFLGHLTKEKIVKTHHRRTAFTLIELLIVLVILGILAAIIVPSFAGATDSSRHSSIVSQLRHIRTAISMYHTEHNGKLPEIANWNDLTTASTFAGKTVGPYLKSQPRNRPTTTFQWWRATSPRTSPAASTASSTTTTTAPETGHIVATDTHGQTLFDRE